MEESPERMSLMCPVCLELLSGPVTIPCGHSFCGECLRSSWREDRDRYPCPQCRKRFVSRPDLNKNIVLADLVEQVLRATPASDQYAGPLDVPCDVCAGRKLKASRSCLQCVVSFCEKHLQPHRDVPMLQKHHLVAPCHKLQENICLKHKEVKTLFCSTDQLFLCELCSQDHQDHLIVSSADERAMRQAELEVDIDLLKNKVLILEADQQQLKETNLSSSQSAKCAEVQCINAFGEIAVLLQKLQTTVMQHIRSEKSKEIEPNTKLQQQLRSEAANLKKSLSDLQELSKTPQDTLFLLLYSAAPSAAPGEPSGSALSAPGEPSGSALSAPGGPSGSALSAPGEPSGSALSAPGSEDQHTATQNILNRPPLDLDHVTRAMKVFKEKFSRFIKEFKLPEPGDYLPEPESRKEFLSYSREIVLEQHTAFSLMSVSDKRRVVFLNKPFRCEECPDLLMQVLGAEALTGRSYWEVDVSQARYVCVAVSYKDFEGEGLGNLWPFGQDDRSWALKVDNGKYFFCHYCVQLEVMGPKTPLIGVYLDHSAGVLSFYAVAEETAHLLHRVQTSFSLPLYAGIGLRHHRDSVFFPKLKPS